MKYFPQLNILYCQKEKENARDKNCKESNSSSDYTITTTSPLN